MSNDRYQTGDFDAGTFPPFVCDLSAVSQAVQAVVTTSSDHGFVVGNTVQFFVPDQYGMRQLDQKKAAVVSIDADDQFTESLDTRTYDTFAIPSLPSLVVISPAQVAGIGDENYGPSSPGGVVSIPTAPQGSFRNIAP